MLTHHRVENLLTAAQVAFALDDYALALELERAAVALREEHDLCFESCCMGKPRTRMTFKRGSRDDEVTS